MSKYALSEPVVAGSKARTVQFVHLAEPIVTHVWDAGGDVTVFAVVVDTLSSGQVVADLYGVDKRGVESTFTVDHFSALSSPMEALLSEVTKGGWQR